MKFSSPKLFLFFSVLFFSSSLFAGLDDLDDLDDLDEPNTEEAKPKKEDSSNKLNYDEELKSGKIKSKPVVEEKKKPAKPIQTEPEAKPLGYVSQKKVKTTPEKEKNPEKQPVKIKSKGLRALKNEGVLELKEDVIITQGNLLLTADYAKVYSNTSEEKDVEKIFIKGDVKISKSSDIPDERVVARGDEATFYNKERKVVLKGNARLWRGGDLIKGKKIDYDMNTGWITVDSAEGIIDPEKGMEQ